MDLSTRHHIRRNILILGFPRYIESIELQNRLARRWKNIEFGQNVHYVLKNYGNSKWKRNQKYMNRILLKSKQFIIYAVLCNVQNWVSWLRISKKEEKWWYWTFNLALKKYGKWFLKTCGNPVIHEVLENFTKCNAGDDVWTKWQVLKLTLNGKLYWFQLLVSRPVAKF